jgi:hypothetical protein
MKKILALVLTLAAIGHAKAQTALAVDSGAISMPAPTAAAPIWGKLVLSGNVVTCYYGKGTAQPTSWIQLGQPQTIQFINNPLLVGVFITSHDVTKVATGTLDNVSITPTPSFRLTDSDIGMPSLMGSSNLINGVWNLSGSGVDVWNAADQFNFQPWLVWGDCTIVCRVTSVSNTNSWTKIGIMIRDGYNSGSDFAMFCATPGNGVDFQYRHTFNNNPDSTTLVTPPAPGTMSTVSVGYSLTGATTYTVRP